MYTVINGRWSHQDGEPLDPIDKNQLSKQIDNMKPIAELTTSNNLSSIFCIINNANSERIQLINKIIEKSDSVITIINQKL